MLNSDEISEFIGNKPTLREYGLTKRLVKEIKDIEEENTALKERVEQIVSRIVLFPAKAILPVAVAVAIGSAVSNRNPFSLFYAFPVVTMGLLYTVFLLLPACLALQWIAAKVWVGAPHPQLSDWKRFLEGQAEHHEALQITSGEFWKALSGWEFEQEFAKVLEGLKFSVTRKGGSGDEGIDLIALKGRQRIAVQCKAHKRPVGPAIAREFYGSMVHGGFRRGILACPSGFSQGTEDFVQGKKISLYGLDELVEAHVRSLS